MPANSESASLRLRTPGGEFVGDALDLPRLDPGAVHAAIHGSASENAAITAHAPEPGPGHDRLGLLPGDDPIVALLAAAARSRGLSSSVDGAVADTRESLSAVTVPDVDLETARERVADASGREDRLRERVAAARGELNALRELDAADDAAVEEAEAALREATATLAEAETERHAAEQALARERERAREARDARDRRLRLEDRLRNRRNEARRELAARVYPDFRDALPAVPGGSEVETGAEPTDYAGDDVTAALAAVRIADLSAPVVVTLSEPRFADAAAARDALDAPVWRVPPEV